jgi:hypothetical protein
MPDAMPDNDINSFLSHEVNPVQQLLRLGVKLPGKRAYRLAAIGQKRQRLRVRHAVGLQHRAQPPF